MSQVQFDKLEIRLEHKILEVRVRVKAMEGILGEKKMFRTNKRRYLERGVSVRMTMNAAAGSSLASLKMIIKR